MATKAYILIETAVGKSRDVVGALTSLPGVRTVDAVTGIRHYLGGGSTRPERGRRPCNKSDSHHQWNRTYSDLFVGGCRLTLEDRRLGAYSRHRRWDSPAASPSLLLATNVWPAQMSDERALQQPDGLQDNRR